MTEGFPERDEVLYNCKMMRHMIENKHSPIGRRDLSA